MIAAQFTSTRCDVAANSSSTHHPRRRLNFILDPKQSAETRFAPSRNVVRYVGAGKSSLWHCQACPPAALKDSSEECLHKDHVMFSCSADPSASACSRPSRRNGWGNFQLCWYPARRRSIRQLAVLCTAMSATMTTTVVMMIVLFFPSVVPFQPFSRNVCEEMETIWNILANLCTYWQPSNPAVRWMLRKRYESHVQSDNGLKRLQTHER